MVCFCPHASVPRAIGSSSSPAVSIVAQIEFEGDLGTKVRLSFYDLFSIAQVVSEMRKRGVSEVKESVQLNRRDAESAKFNEKTFYHRDTEHIEF